MTAIYKCENCGKTFDEFEMNYRDAQIDKLCWCRECREKLPDKLMICPKDRECTYGGCTHDEPHEFIDGLCNYPHETLCPNCVPYDPDTEILIDEYVPMKPKQTIKIEAVITKVEPQSQLYILQPKETKYATGTEEAEDYNEGVTCVYASAKKVDIDALANKWMAHEVFCSNIPCEPNMKFSEFIMQELK